MWRIKADGEITELEGGQARRNTVWVPTSDITFHRAQFPSANRKVWRQTAAFALEEFIIGRIEEYHFALDDTPDEDNRVSVAVVPGALLDDWLERLEGEGVKGEVFWPDLLAVPFAEGQLVLWHENGECWLRTGACEGMAGGVDWVCGVIAAIDLEGELKVFSDAPDALPEDLRERAESLPAPLQELMSRPEDEFGRVNLLQGDYAPESPMKLWLGAWKRTAMVAGLSLALYLGYIVVESERLRVQTGELQKETGVLLARAGFPAQAAQGDMRLQVGRFLEKIRGTDKQKSVGVWGMVLNVEPLLSSCKPCIVERIDYDSEELVLVVSSAPDLSRFEEGLQGLPAARYERNDLPGDEGRERARFRIRGSGA